MTNTKPDSRKTAGADGPEKRPGPAGKANLTAQRGGEGKPLAAGGGGGGQGRGRLVARRPGGRPQMQRTQARVRFRHWLVLFSFFLLVVLPGAYANWYLQARAVDQYASRLSFTIQSEDMPSMTDLGSFLSGGSSGSASDAEILYGFIQSQNLVELLQEELDLKTRYNRFKDQDWWFSLGDDKSIEELTDYWKSMVLVSSNAGIVELEVRAFNAADAKEIAEAVLRESTLLVNRLSEEAREDAVRDARLYLDETADRLRDVRKQIGDLREDDQRVDPSLDVTAMMTRIGDLEAGLTAEQLKLAELEQFAAPSDSRVKTVNWRIKSLEAAIAEEREKLVTGGGSGALAQSVGRFEELAVDREIAERAYGVALASFESAKAEARRQQRYLSAHVAPTLAETAEYPEREMLGGLAVIFLFMGWVVLVMIAYNIKDRR